MEIITPALITLQQLHRKKMILLKYLKKF